MFSFIVITKLVNSCRPISYHLTSDFLILHAVVKPVKPPTKTFKSERNNEVGELIDGYSVNFMFLQASQMLYLKQFNFGFTQLCCVIYFRAVWVKLRVNKIWFELLNVWIKSQ